MSISAIAFALAAQAAGQEVTTFHPLPGERKQEQAQQPPAGQAAGAAAPAAKAAPAAAEPEKIEVVSVRDVPANANVRFVPPEGEKPE